MQILLVEAWQQKGGEELTSHEETVRLRHTKPLTHKGRNIQSCAEGQAGTHILGWMTKSNRHPNNFLLFTKTSMSNRNIMFGADQTA